MPKLQSPSLSNPMHNSGNNASESRGAQLFVIEGIDGSGKGTQATRLYESLTHDGVRCELFSFPRYGHTFFGERIGDFLNGEFGTLNELNPFLVALLFAGDRFESRSHLVAAISRAELVILDRYVPSNIAHQSAKLTGADRNQLQIWIEKIEYEIFAMPRPDQVVLMDTPVEVSQNFIAQKAERDYTNRTVDLQEADVPYLAKVREVYLNMAHAQPEWTIVPVVDEQGLRSIDSIAQVLLELARSLVR